MLLIEAAGTMGSVWQDLRTVYTCMMPTSEGHIVSKLWEGLEGSRFVLTAITFILQRWKAGSTDSLQIKPHPLHKSRRY